MKNVKETLNEGKKLHDEGAIESQELKDIEEAVMNEDDFSKLGVLFEQYREMYYSEERERRMRESRNGEGCKTAK